MRQFGKILRFEISGYLKNKIFVGITIFLMAVIVGVMFFPNISSFFKSGEESADRPVMLVYAKDSDLTMLAGQQPELAYVRDVDFTMLVMRQFEEAFSEYDVREAEGTVEDVKARISAGDAECAFVLDSAFSYTYYVNNLAMNDVNRMIADTVLKEIYRMNAMVQNGIAPQRAGEIMSAQVESSVVALGKDQMQSFFYTYIMVFALYMAILLYGQMVATHVAAEKSSRAMELLITSANPVSMMFGKVLASCIAGLAQLAVIFGSALALYKVNGAAWGENEVMKSIFNIPVDMFAYMLVFFVLGFLIYAFMYGAIGSTVSKLEDINTSVMPVTFLFIIAFFVVVFSMSNGEVDSVLMWVCSYIPFTSPMAMFTRICMSTVSWHEIAISIAVLIGATAGVGYLSAKIYRVGVLLYGATPKIGSIIKAVWNA